MYLLPGQIDIKDLSFLELKTIQGAILIICIIEMSLNENFVEIVNLN